MSDEPKKPPEPSYTFVGHVPLAADWEKAGPRCFVIELAKSEVIALVAAIDKAARHALDDDGLGYMGSVYRDFHGYWRRIDDNGLDFVLSHDEPWHVLKRENRLIARYETVDRDTKVSWVTPDGVYWSVVSEHNAQLRTETLTRSFLADVVFSVFEQLALIENDEPLDEKGRPRKPGAYRLSLTHEGKEITLSALVHQKNERDKTLYVLIGDDPTPHPVTAVKAGATWVPVTT